MTRRGAPLTHWPLYLIEAWALGMFMLSASVVTTELEYPGAPLGRMIGDPRLRLALIGLAMGSTAVGLIYSPWGKRSGAHMNPAVTLAFLTLGRISGTDALFYMLAQFAGGLLGVLASWRLLGAHFALPPVSLIATVPGSAGAAAAFLAEISISLVLMLAILEVSNHRRWSQCSGLGLRPVDRLLRDIRIAAIGNEHEPGAYAGVGLARPDLDRALDLPDRTLSGHVDGGAYF